MRSKKLWARKFVSIYQLVQCSKHLFFFQLLVSFQVEETLPQTVCNAEESRQILGVRTRRDCRSV